MTQKDRALAEIDASGVLARQRWRHWKGAVYTIVATGIVEGTLDPVVMYAGSDGIVWVRPLYVFLEDVSPGRPRFVPVLDDAVSVVPTRRGCAFSEHSCKASTCPEHGWLPATRERAHPMAPQPRGGRFL